MTRCCHVYTSGFISPKEEFTVCSWCGLPRAESRTWHETYTHLIALRKEVLTRRETQPWLFFLFPHEHVRLVFSSYLVNLSNHPQHCLSNVELRVVVFDGAMTLTNELAATKYQNWLLKECRFSQDDKVLKKKEKKSRQRKVTHVLLVWLCAPAHWMWNETMIGSFTCQISTLIWGCLPPVVKTHVVIVWSTNF